MCRSERLEESGVAVTQLMITTSPILKGSAAIVDHPMSISIRNGIREPRELYASIIRKVCGFTISVGNEYTRNGQVGTA